MALHSRLNELVPGGAHTYAKGDDQYPRLAPPLIERGLGCHIWDTDGNEYIEYAMGLRAVTLGHGFPAVVEAAAAQMVRGTNFNRPAMIEAEAAERFCAMIPGAEMVKFTKDGSTATTAAVKLARAYTGRDGVALCSDQPFFSYDDWAMNVTPVDAGIPTTAGVDTHVFGYGDLESARAMFDANPDGIACVILEAAKWADPPEGYLQQLRDLCHAQGALLIFDENITGFRWHRGGAQAYYGVVPDLCCFGKAVANGFAVSALGGRREIMRLGGLDHDAERVFLLSTTHGGETHALAAAIATMGVYQEQPVIEHLYRQGERLAAGCNRAIRDTGMGAHVEIIGKPCCLAFVVRDHGGAPSQSHRSLFLQELVRRGIISPSLIVSYSHEDRDIDHTIAAFEEALAVLRRGLDEGVEILLDGPPSKSVYRRFN